MAKNNIVLIGMMGTAKTTVGRELAAVSDRLFYDSDALFCERFGAVERFFDSYGEGMFRVEESKILYELSRKENAVIACGGGAVLNPANMRLLKERGVIVLLTASDGVIFSRVKDDNSRPLLKGDALKNIAKLQRERAPLYKRYADFSVCTDEFTPRQAAEEILKLVKTAL